MTRMNEAMKELRVKAEKAMSQEPAFSSKEDALKEAINQSNDDFTSVWKAPPEMGGKYVVVKQENREDAFICDYTEVYDTGSIFDMKKKNIDQINEV